MPKLDITSQQRSALRAAAHPLNPVVLIGDKGLTPAVLKEIDLNLSAHELIKIKINSQDRAERESTLEAICESLSCAPVHHLGKTLILYRPDTEKSKAQELALNTTRAVRKPSEPYIPKKLAAEGVRRKPKPAKAARRTETDEAGKRPIPKVGRARPAPHGIPRRTGSALTLRAGVRRSPTSGTRKR